jgi:hypothetical protein
VCRSRCVRIPDVLMQEPRRHAARRKAEPGSAYSRTCDGLPTMDSRAVARMSHPA